MNSNKNSGNKEIYGCIGIIGAALVTGVITMIIASPTLIPFFFPTSTPVVFYTPTFGVESPTPIAITDTLTPVVTETSSQESYSPTPPEISEQDAYNWNLIFQDTFDEKREWALGFDETDNFTINRLLESGKYVWDMKLKDKDSITGAAPDIALLSDFYVSTEVKQIDGVANASYGIAFRKDINDNLYSFEITSQQYYAIYILYNHKSSKIIDWTKADVIRPFDTNRLSIIAQNSHFYIFINNQFVGEFTDTTLPKGKAGLVASLYNPNDHVVLEFDNFDIRTP